MGWTDLTHSLNQEFPVWPGEKNFFSHSSYKEKHCQSSNLSFNAHTGTHIDAPSHFIPGGKSVDDFDINHLSGRVQIIDIGDNDFVDSKHTLGLKEKIVFFKTKNKISWNFSPDYCYISPEAAKFLVNKKVKIVGIDYLSVENFYDAEFTTHKILLGADIIIVESINLQDTRPGIYETMIVSLRLHLEASPARVLIRPLT